MVLVLTPPHHDQEIPSFPSTNTTVAGPKFSCEIIADILGTDTRKHGEAMSVEFCLLKSFRLNRFLTQIFECKNKFEGEK